MNKDEDYNYENAGFSGYLTRSLVDASGTAQSFQARQLNFEQSQISGALGDTLKIGRIFINGAEGNIIVNDGENDRVLIGFDADAF